MNRNKPQSTLVTFVETGIKFALYPQKTMYDRQKLVLEHAVRNLARLTGNNKWNKFEFGFIWGKEDYSTEGSIAVTKKQRFLIWRIGPRFNKKEFITAVKSVLKEANYEVYEIHK